MYFAKKVQNTDFIASFGIYNFVCHFCDDISEKSGPGSKKAAGPHFFLGFFLKIGQFISFFLQNR